LKKSFYIVGILIILLLSFSCTRKVPYTKEIPYLPSMQGMVFEKEEKSNEKSKNYVYDINNTTYEKVLENYEPILKKDGWKITEDKKPTYISATKGENNVILIPQKDGGKVKMVVVTR
jgi:hypothetical protein